MLLAVPLVLQLLQPNYRYKPGAIDLLSESSATQGHIVASLGFFISDFIEWRFVNTNCMTSKVGDNLSARLALFLGIFRRLFVAFLVCAVFAGLGSFSQNPYNGEYQAEHIREMDEISVGEETIQPGFWDAAGLVVSGKNTNSTTSSSSGTGTTSSSNDLVVSSSSSSLLGLTDAEQAGLLPVVHAGFREVEVEIPPASGGPHLRGVPVRRLELAVLVSLVLEEIFNFVGGEIMLKHGIPVPRANFLRHKCAVSQSFGIDRHSGGWVAKFCVK